MAATICHQSEQVDGQDEACEPYWLIPNVDDLLPDLRGRIYGQHLAIEMVAGHIRKHLTNASPARALVLSFHGPSGVGKTYMARLVAKNLYRLGEQSQFVSKISMAHSYYDVSKIGAYRAELQQTIINSLKLCKRSLFILEEVDDDEEILHQLAQTLKPFMDVQESVGGVDSRKAIFILISNVAGDSLLQHELEWYDPHSHRCFDGLRSLWTGEPAYLDDRMRKRLIAEEAANHRGLRTFVQNNLITEFVPFLPLRMKHVDMCIKDVIIQRNLPRYILAQTPLVHRELCWIPNDRSPIFSVSGCKRVDEKVTFVLDDAQKEMKQQQLQF